SPARGTVNIAKKNRPAKRQARASLTPKYRNSVSARGSRSHQASDTVSSRCASMACNVESGPFMGACRVSGLHNDIEATEGHACMIEGHRRWRRQARVLHDLGIDPVAVRLRLVHDPGEDHGFILFRSGHLAEAGELRRNLQIIADAFVIFECTVLTPDLAGLAGDLA